MTVEKMGISVIVVTQASIWHWLEVPNRQGNYPFTYLMSLIVCEFTKRASIKDVRGRGEGHPKVDKAKTFV